MEVSLELPIAVCKQFSTFSVEFTIQNPEPVERPAKDSTRATIATVLMKKVKLHGRPTNNDLVKNNADQLYNDLIDYLAEKTIFWAGSVIELTGVKSVVSLTNLL